MARKTTKAEKIAAHDGLVDFKGMADLVFSDIARGVSPYMCEGREPDDRGETAVARGRMFRTDGGHAGIVLLLTYTIDADGDEVGHATRLVQLDHMTDGIDGYGRGAMERAIVLCARGLKDYRARVFDGRKPLVVVEQGAS